VAALAAAAPCSVAGLPEYISGVTPVLRGDPNLAVLPAAAAAAVPGPAAGDLLPGDLLLLLPAVAAAAAARGVSAARGAA
jgi:hypothetical protein